MVAAMGPAWLVCLVVGATPTVTATVTVDPSSGRLDVEARIQADSGFDLAESLVVTSARCAGQPCVLPRRGARVDPPESRPVDLQIRYSGSGPRRGPDHVHAREVLLVSRRFAWLPDFGRPTDVRLIVQLPKGWQAVAAGEPRSSGRRQSRQGPFVAHGVPFSMLVARPDWRVRQLGGLTVRVTADHAAALDPLLALVQRQLTALGARFGARPTDRLEVVEAGVDGGYAVHGLLALNPLAVASFAEGQREATLVAHELCHQWFGSRAGGPMWMVEGTARHCEIWWRRRADGDAAAEAFIARLATQANQARPGLTLASTRHEDVSWRDYEAVVYSRGALVHEHLRSRLGAAVHDRFLRRHLDEHAGRVAKTQDVLRVLREVVPPSFDVDDFEARYLEADVDARTGHPRPHRWTVSARAAGLVALAFAMLLAVVSIRVANREVVWMGLVMVLGAGAFALWRGPGWTPGAPVAVAGGASLACAFVMGIGRYRAGGLAPVVLAVAFPSPWPLAVAALAFVLERLAARRPGKRGGEESGS